MKLFIFLSVVVFAMTATAQDETARPSPLDQARNGISRAYPAVFAAENAFFKAMNDLELKAPSLNRKQLFDELIALYRLESAMISAKHELESFELIMTQALRRQSFSEERIAREIQEYKSRISIPDMQEITKSANSVDEFLAKLERTRGVKTNAKAFRKAVNNKELRGITFGKSRYRIVGTIGMLGALATGITLAPPDAVTERNTVQISQ